MKPTPRKLKNGMTVMCVPMKGAESMTMIVMVKVGSRYERKEINGASHFIEHLMFKGTKRRPTTEILTRTLDQFGAEYNAFTGKDMTGYYIKIDASQTSLAVDMLHDMIFHSTYAQKEIDRERNVIIEEINMYEDNPRMHLEDLLEEAMFQDSTLGWNITGPRQVIREMTREQILAYRDAYYVPARMTIVVAGKIVPGLMGMIEKTFGRVRSRATRQDVAFVPFVPPAKITKPVAFQKKETEQVQLAMAFYGLPVGHKDLPTVGLLSTILGGSMSSRLFIEIRERRGLCYSIRASHDTLEDTGVFSITAGLDKKRIDEAVQEIHKQLRRITQELVTPQELRRAKDHIRGRLMLAFEDSETQAEWYGRQWVFNGSLETPDERLKKIERVKASDIRTLAASLFVPDRMAGAIIGPLRDVKDATRIMNSSAK